MINEIAPCIFDNTYDGLREVKEDDFILCYRENMILLKDSGNQSEIPLYRDIENISGHHLRFLFCLNSHNCFLLHEYPVEKGPLTYQDVWLLRSSYKKEHAWIGAVGLQLMNWYENHKFCGKCGAKTELKNNERAIYCPVCHHSVYPNISPAVIVAITCNDKILLARGKHYKGDFYALIAGYVDIGESLEEAVIREVKEETGLEIKNIRYYKSQPWPFSGSMMIGFFAEADDTHALKINKDEIEEAAWFTRGNLPPRSSNISISGDLIDAFEKRAF